MNFLHVLRGGCLGAERWLAVNSQVPVVFISTLSNNVLRTLWAWTICPVSRSKFLPTRLWFYMMIVPKMLSQVVLALESVNTAMFAAVLAGKLLDIIKVLIQMSFVIRIPGEFGGTVNFLASICGMALRLCMNR